MKRKRSAIKKARAAINAEADRLIKAGVLQHPERKVTIVGGGRPERIQPLTAKNDILW